MQELSDEKRSDCVQGSSNVQQETADDVSMSDCVSNVHVKLQETADDVSDCLSLEMHDEDYENAKLMVKHDEAVCVVVAENVK